VILFAATVDGAYGIDLETEEVAPAEPFPPQAAPPLNLPRLVAAAASGSTLLAALDMRPPLAVSYDAGVTWRESGRGLAPGVAVAIAESDPDTMAFATRNRLYVSGDGGVFWTALGVELPEIVALELREA
jgi:hypothetical protein